MYKTSLPFSIVGVYVHSIHNQCCRYYYRPSVFPYTSKLTSNLYPSRPTTTLSPHIAEYTSVHKMFKCVPIVEAPYSASV